MKNVLNKVEVKVLNKLGLTKEDIFPVKRADAKDNLDAVSYIAIKGYVEGAEGAQGVLSLAIYPETNKISFSIYNKSTETKKFLNSKQFKVMLGNLKEFEGAEDIDSI